VNKVINSIDESPKKSKYNFKFAMRFALPAMMIVAVFCIQIFYSNIPQPVADNPSGSGSEANVAETPKKSNNWFSIIAYAADTEYAEDSDILQIEIKRDMKVQFPSLQLLEESAIIDDEIVRIVYTYSHYDTAGFKFEGENIKFIDFESKNGWVNKIPIIYEGSQSEDIETYFNIPRTTTLEGNDIFKLMVTWVPFDYQTAIRLGEDYIEYLTDIITITVTFEDGEVMTQYVEMTIDDDGYVYAQIIG